MPNTIVIDTTSSSHARAVLTETVRVRTHLGDGVLRYATDDGWLGVQLDGETRVDEYQPSQVTRLESEHVVAALVEVRRAAHWLTQFSAGYPGRDRLVAEHAAEAGRRMAFAGSSCDRLLVLAPDVPADELICAPLRAAHASTLAALAA